MILHSIKWHRVVLEGQYMSNVGLTQRVLYRSRLYSSHYQEPPVKDILSYQGNQQQTPMVYNQNPHPEFFGGLGLTR